MAAPDPLIPVGAWIRIQLPERPDLIAFTYVDQEAGFSAQGFQAPGEQLDQSARVIVRLPMPGLTWRLLTPKEVGRFGLTTPPSWVQEFYGPQPPAGMLWGAWREHPKLKGRLLPDYPDDLQVFVHDGGPRLTRNPPELVWVRVNGMNAEVFSGRLLNQPHNLQSVRQGDQIQFLVPEGGAHPILVTAKYLRERKAWFIYPCRGCGLSELFDAPSDLLRVVFPNMPAGGRTDMFTAFCPLCGGVQGVKSVAERPAGEDAEEPLPSRRPWWKFWG